MADDDVALRVMQEAAELGIVALAHCENGRAVDVLTRQCVAEGRLGTRVAPRQPADRARGGVRAPVPRPRRDRRRAPPYVVHVTGRAPLDEIRTARRRGQTVHAEVCPHHLLFERSHHEGPDALRYVMTPPLRTADDRAALLEGLTTGDVNTYASDHCHLRLDRDKVPVRDDFTKVPTGLPGIGARLPLGFALGGAEAPLAVERLVDAACTQPARIFGLYPRKGIVAPGSDADIVVWDPSAPTRLTLAAMNDGLDWTPYDGIEVPGRVRDVIARGERVVEDGRWVGDEHRGEYLPVAHVLETA